jgi:hypothetical protein
MSFGLVLRSRLTPNVQVATTVAEMSSDAAAKLWDDTINRRLFDLIHSQNTVEKLGGLLAIGWWHRPHE